MITFSDREYKATKRIKQGKGRLNEPFLGLASWIQETWDVTVLNVIYDRPTSLRGPRLQIILEHATHERQFHRGVNYDPEKQNLIAERFLDLVGSRKEGQFDLDGLFVVFSAFAPLAKQEADAQITDEEVDQLQRRIGNPELWRISRCFGHVTFLFFTDQQVSKHETSGFRGRYGDLYFEILKPHDEFGYLKRQEFEVAFDSKRNFDNNFGGNWFNYYR